MYFAITPYIICNCLLFFCLFFIKLHCNIFLIHWASLNALQWCLHGISKGALLYGWPGRWLSCSITTCLPPIYFSNFITQQDCTRAMAMTILTWPTDVGTTSPLRSVGMQTKLLAPIDLNGPVWHVVQYFHTFTSEFSSESPLHEFPLTSESLIISAPWH